MTGQDLGGLTLTPGVYHFDSSASLSGILTLDAQGNPNARFDFQIGTTLITGNGSAIQLVNGAQADNVYFQVGTSATLGTNTAFDGNILADQSVTLTTGASMLNGRALALVGAVTMDTNQVTTTEADIAVTNSSSAGTVVRGHHRHSTRSRSRMPAPMPLRPCRFRTSSPPTRRSFLRPRPRDHYSM